MPTAMSWLLQLLKPASIVFVFIVFIVPLEERVEQRAILKFLVKNGHTPIECWRQLRQVHGANCMSKNRVRVWHRRFRNGWTDTKDQKRPGRPKSARTAETIQAVEDAIRGERRVTVRDLAENLSMSKSSVHNIIQKDLKMSKIAPKFIPKDLTEDQKNNQLEACRANIELVRDDPSLLQRVVTCDESWVSVFELETKQNSMEWHPKGTRVNRPRKAMKQRLERKAMLTAFFDRQGIVHTEFKDPGVNITKEAYCATLRRMKESLRRKRPQLWARDDRGKRSFILHQDNASPHMADVTVELLESSGIDQLQHPPYSPDLAPCDFFLFPRLKRDLRGVRFRNIEEMKKGVNRVLRNITKQEFAAAIDSVTVRWMKCVKAQGNYFEGNHLQIDPEGDHGIQFETDSEFED